MNKKLLVSVVILALIAIGGYMVFKKNFSEETTVPDKISLPDEVKNTAGANTLKGFTMPEGWSMSIFAKDVPGARVLEIDPVNNILVSETSAGKIVALIDKNSDGVAEDKKIIASDLNKPHGIAMSCRNVGGTCFLYVAERDALSRYEYNSEGPTLGVKEKLMDIASSAADRHFTRSLLFLPGDEDILLISTGSSCDVCEEKDTDHAAILSYNIRTKEKGIYATGLRNATFMALDPITGKVFATEMGRDNLGDEVPPDEINIIKKDAWYGWPWFYGKNVEDMKFSPNARPSFAKEPVPSFIDLQAHSAPLGFDFVPEEGWPEDYWYDMLVAYHGSWNRTAPTGYKIIRLKMNAKGEYQGAEDFISGWLTAAGKKTGRPVDIKVLPGGTAYISDDSAGVIYRLWKNK